MGILSGKSYMFLPAAAAVLVLWACGRKGPEGGSAPALNRDKLFTASDLKQTAETGGAETITLKNGDEISIKKEGVYVLRGNARNACVTVNAKKAQVQLVLDSLSVVNSGQPVISVKNADKVLITMAQGSENSLSVTGEIQEDKSGKANAVIFSREDLTLNGSGRMKLSSGSRAVTSKKNLLITGGTYVMDTEKTAVEAADSIRIADGDIRIRSGNDGIHAGDDEDTEKGTVYIGDGSLDIKAEDDCIHAVPIVQVDGGTLNLNGHECMEGTWIQINGGTLNMRGLDDAINATRKAKDYYDTRTEITGGNIRITIPAPEADGIDCNGSLVITGGTLDITGASVFDVTKGIRFTGGTVLINGEKVTSLEKYNTAE